MISARNIDQNGFVTIERNPISRAGVFQYSGRSLPGADPAQIYNVYRPAEELASPEALESLKLLPLYDEHEMVGTGYATAPEDKQPQGTLGETITFEDNTLFASLRIFSERLKALIASGKKGLSLGYRCVYEKSVGEFNGIPYDYIQRQIRGNHIALVNEGRCDVAVLDHHFALDHFDLALQPEEFQMADEETKAEGESEKKEPTLAEVAAIVESIVPVIAKINETLATLGAAKTDDLETGLDEGKEDDKKDEKKDDAKDEDSEKEKEAMDAAEKINSRIDALEKRGTKAILADVAARDALVREISPVVGTFDHAEMTADEVAEYAVKKIGLTVAKGQERATLNGYLLGHKKSSVGFAMDTKALKSEGKLAKRLNGAQA
jgi:hypothetical protein